MQSISHFALRFRFAVLAITAISLGGCGGSGVDTHPVSGTVTYSGKPVPNVAITFNPDGGGLVATGMTDAEGRFASITTRDPGDGAKPGSYIVTLSPKTDVTAEITSADAYAEPSTDNLPFPAKYLNTTMSDLRVTVDANTGDITLELKD